MAGICMFIACHYLQAKTDWLDKDSPYILLFSVGSCELIGYIFSVPDRKEIKAHNERQNELRGCLSTLGAEVNLSDSDVIKWIYVSYFDQLNQISEMEGCNYILHESVLLGENNNCVYIQYKYATSESQIKTEHAITWRFSSSKYWKLRNFEEENKFSVYDHFGSTINFQNVDDLLKFLNDEYKSRDEYKLKVHIKNLREKLGLSLRNSRSKNLRQVDAALDLLSQDYYLRISKGNDILFEEVLSKEPVFSDEGENTLRNKVD